MKKGQVIIDVVNGVEGPSLYIGDEDSGHRLAGPKPWGGGSVVFKFIVDVAELQEEAARFGKALQRTWVGLTDEMVVAAARVLNERQADACGVDRDDQWAIYSDDFKADALAMLKAAHGIKENT